MIKIWSYLCEWYEVRQSVKVKKGWVSKSKKDKD